MLTAEQLERRRRGLGATDVVALVGLSSFASPWDVYREKTDPTFARTTSGLAARIGQHMESFILELYEERTGRDAYASDTVAHPTHAWALATPDAVIPERAKDVIASADGEPNTWYGPLERLVEIKRPTIYTAHEWGHEAMGAEGAPPRYVVQCAWQMFVTGAPRCDLVALIGDDDLRIYQLERDHELIGALFERARSFWVDNVLARVPPAIDGSEAAADYVARMFPKAARPRLRADGELECLARDYGDACEAFKAAESRKDTLANRLKAAIGEHVGAWGDGWSASYGEQAGGIDYARAAADAGVTGEALEQYRRPGFRALRVTFKEKT